MKNVLIFTILGGFFSLILFYLLKEFSPFELAKINELIKTNAIGLSEWDKLNDIIKELVSKGLIFQYLSNWAYFAFGVALAGIFCYITAIHLFLDKLFFRSFYEKPSLFNAIRRSALIVATAGLVFYMKLSLIEGYLMLLVPAAAFVIELIFITTINPFIKVRLERQNKEKTEPVKPVTPKVEIPTNDSETNSEGLL